MLRFRFVVLAAILLYFGIVAKTDIKPVAAIDTRYSVSIPDIAARCKGEANFAITQCVCTVKERIENGWSLDRVLWHYYAADVAPTAEEIAIADDVLSGRIKCEKGMYYMFSSSDIKGLGLLPSKATLVVESDGRKVYFYPISTFKRGG